MKDTTKTVEGAELLHPETVEKVAARMPDDNALFDLAELFKVFGDSTRIRILSALSVNELCVNDLSALLGMTQSAISHQLKSLRSAKLVRMRKDGKVVYYSLDDEHVNSIIAIGMQHVGEDVR
jgi:ArsR family transcriptional regulator